MRRTFFLSFFLLALFVYDSTAREKLPPVIYDLSPLLADPSSQIPLVGENRARFRSALGSAAKILFEDKLPGANWGHPAAFQLISREGRVIEEVPTQFPPKGLNDFSVVSGVAPEPSGPIEFKLKDWGGQLKVKDPSSHHALLINGQANQRHWNDFSFLFRTLIQIYGYSRGNILVADSVFKQSMPDLDGDGSPDILHGSTIADIRRLILTLKEKLRLEDQLLIVVNDHGNIVGGESTIVLTDGEMKVSELTQMLKEIPAERMIAVYEQCFSGGFVRPSLGPRRVAMAASSDIEFSFASKDLNFDEFLYHIISAFAKQTHDGTPIGADLNGDGRISAQEAFAHALGRDDAPESPLLESGVNLGTAAIMGLGF